GEPAALGVRERLVNQACGFGELVAELANGADRAIEQSREGALVELVATERARDVFSCIARVRRNASGPFSNSVDSAENGLFLCRRRSKPFEHVIHTPTAESSVTSEAVPSEAVAVTSCGHECETRYASRT